MNTVLESFNQPVVRKRCNRVPLYRILCMVTLVLNSCIAAKKQKTGYTDPAPQHVNTTRIIHRPSVQGQANPLPSIDRTCNEKIANILLIANALQSTIDNFILKEIMQQLSPQEVIQIRENLARKLFQLKREGKIIDELLKSLSSGQQTEQTEQTKKYQTALLERVSGYVQCSRMLVVPFTQLITQWIFERFQQVEHYIESQCANPSMPFSILHDILCIITGEIKKICILYKELDDLGCSIIDKLVCKKPIYTPLYHDLCILYQEIEKIKIPNVNWCTFCKKAVETVQADQICLKELLYIYSKNVAELGSMVLPSRHILTFFEKLVDGIYKYNPLVSKRIESSANLLQNCPCRLYKSLKTSKNSESSGSSQVYGFGRAPSPTIVRESNTVLNLPCSLSPAVDHRKNRFHPYSLGKGTSPTGAVG